MKPYIFNTAQVTQECIAWIKHWMQHNGNDQTKVVIGISGGKDSTVVAALCATALGKDRVVGVMMPNGVQPDIDDSKRIIDFLGIQSLTININDAFQGITQAISQALPNQELTPQYKTNTPARLRMTTLYGIGAMLGNARVVNTCNRSEDVQGYSTHYGDSAGDFAPVAKLTTEEVVAMGDYLGLPYELTHKAPSDGMCGKTDEDNLGWTYHEINQIIRENEVGEHYDAIVKRYLVMQFKLHAVQLPAFKPELPDYFAEKYGI
ncbi:MAG: NAD(+) synthase [Paludibacteraceae bacterium]|jgi:NAD+ synthase|nr:NAD(+) synthase [Paludibacteraceae bacterium]